MANRVTQTEAEVVIAPTDAKARVTDVQAEVVINPTDAKARVTDVEGEVVIAPTDAKFRVSQVVVEVISQYSLSLYTEFSLASPVEPLQSPYN